MARIDYRANASRGHFELPAPENLSDAESIAAIEKHEGELADADFAEVRLIAELSERREAEMERGVNLVGPHRDDLALTLGSLPARGYASHGESWSYALALKLAAWEILRADVSGEWAEDGEPILILDDVFSELDAGRRERLAGIVSRAGQVFVTVAVGSELPEGIERTAIACRRWKDESSGRGCRRCLRERSPERGVKPVERISSRCVNSTEFAKRLSLGERCGFASRWPHRRMTGRTMGTVRPLKNRLATRCGLLVPVGGMWVPVRVPPDADPRPIGQLLGRFVRDRGWTQRLEVASVVSRWDEIVGPTVARHCTVEEFAEDGTLTLRTSSTSWETQIRALLATLETTLAEEIGEGVVKRIVVKGPALPNWKHGRFSVPGRGVRDTYD